MSLEILDAIYQESALDAMDGKATADDRRWAEGVSKRVQSRLAELRRNLVPAAVPLAKAKPVRSSLIAMGRDALLAKLEALTGPSVRYAHRNLDGLSDDDLRRLVDTLDPD
jgi:hypothetical protein